MLNRSSRLAAAIAAAFVVAACGGGGGSGTATAPTAPTPAPQPTLSISGTAATGAAIAGVTVETECANGAQASATTGPDGNFTLSVPGGVAPCLLGLTNNNQELLSIFFGQQRANITPLTQLVIAYLAGRAGLPGNFTADDFVDNPSYASIVGNQANIDAGIAAVRQRLLDEYGVDVGVNFVNEEIVTPSTANPNGNEADQRLEALRTAGAIDANGRPAQADLNAAANQGNMDATMNPEPQPEPEPETPPNNGGGLQPGAASQCVNPVLSTVGTETSFTYRSTSGGTTVTSTVNSMITGRTTFQGNSALEQVTSTGVGADVKTYFDVNGNESTFFGSLVEVTTAGVTSTSTTVFNPPSVIRDFTLEAGGTLMRSESSTTTTSVTGAPAQIPDQTSTNSSTITVTYLGIESVTVPAGTFQACKFREEIVSGASTTIVEEWFAVGSGVSVKQTSDGTPTELVSGTINGMAVAP